MSSESTLILLGILVVITPYSGIPSFWYGYILPILGLFIIGIGFLFRGRRISLESINKKETIRNIANDIDQSATETYELHEQNDSETSNVHKEPSSTA